MHVVGNVGWELYGGRPESAPASCLQTSTCVVWHDHVHTHKGVNVRHFKNTMKKLVKWNNVLNNERDVYNNVLLALRREERILSDTSVYM